MAPALSLLLGPLVVAASAPADSPRDPEVARRIVEAHADFAYTTYDRCVAGAEKVREAIAEFVENPTPGTLDGARRAWLAAREDYGVSEVLRFSGGPIDNRQDGVETYINAWPVDEAYIDRVEGAPESGIIGDVEHYPNLSATLLTFANERGGEANISIGWHAIEFLLWGQDLSLDGPGKRTADDFVAGKAPHAERRGQYLKIVADLLVEHLSQVRAAWAPETGGYRASFLAKPTDDAIRDILRGLVVLSGFEMAGERMAVALETRDQEDEHSCFSDNTHRDYLANQRGVMAVWFGKNLAGKGPGLRALALVEHRELAEEIDRLLKQSMERLYLIPVPFDRTIQAPDESSERRLVTDAVVSLEEQAETLAALGLKMGYEIPIQPGDGK